MTIALREMTAAGDPKMTSGADGRPEGAANGEDLALTLYTRGQKVVVLLTGHWPGRRSYHHRGDFAFYLPSRLPEGACESGDLYARLLAAFIRVFDRVVVRESPTDLQDLHRRLLKHTGR